MWFQNRRMKWRHVEEQKKKRQQEEERRKRRVTTDTEQTITTTASTTGQREQTLNEKISAEIASKCQAEGDSASDPSMEDGTVS